MSLRLRMSSLKKMLYRAKEQLKQSDSVSIESQDENYSRLTNPKEVESMNEDPQYEKSGDSGVSQLRITSNKDNSVLFEIECDDEGYHYSGSLKETNRDQVSNVLEKGSDSDFVEMINKYLDN